MRLCLVLRSIQLTAEHDSSNACSRPVRNWTDRGAITSWQSVKDLDGFIGTPTACTDWSRKDAVMSRGKAGILRCHPDLAGRDLQSGTLTAESEQEQVAAGLRSLEPADATRLQRLNLQYKERFGYPFVICARLNDRAAILRQLAERLANEPQWELPLAIEEVKKICCLRLRRIVASDSKL